MPAHAPRFARRALAAALALLAPPACVQFSPVVTRPPTLGEELLSLDAARKDGLLTDEEYARRRAEAIATWKAIGTAAVEVLSKEDDE